MRFTWTSRQGQQRQSNKDALGICQLPDGQWLIMLVDVSEKKGNQGQAFAMHWAGSVLQKAQASQLAISANLIQEWIYEAQQQLRHQFLHEIASFTLLWLDEHRGGYQSFSLGDCRLANIDPEGQRHWITQPRVYEHQYLLKALKARRYERPEVVTGHWHSQYDLELSTDGFWREHLEDGFALQELEDDASCLRIAPGAYGLKVNSDTDNLLLMLLPEQTESTLQGHPTMHFLSTTSRRMETSPTTLDSTKMLILKHPHCQFVLSMASINGPWRH